MKKTTTTPALKHSDFARDFSASTRRALLKKGIAILGIRNLPGAGDMPYANGTRGYELADNGTFRIRTHAEVRAMAESV